MAAMDTALCPINAMPALMPPSGLLKAAQSTVWPLDIGEEILPAFRMAQPYPCYAAMTTVQGQSGMSMLLSGRPATQTTAVRAIAAKQVS